MRTGFVAAVIVVVLLAGVASYYALRPTFGDTTTTITTTSFTTTTTTSTTTSSSQSTITSYSVCFSPGGNCATQILQLIAKANSTIHIMIYSFDNTQIAAALVNAKDRGVDVKVIMDGSEANSTNVDVVQILNTGGVPLKIYTPPGGIVHDKVAIIDGKVVITGSYNWTNAAENYNDENLLILYSSSLAAQYETEFQSLWTVA